MPDKLGERSITESASDSLTAFHATLRENAIWPFWEVSGKVMIGDAPGDQFAATENGALFFPINPGLEEASWKRLHNEGLDHFFAGTFTGDYQQQLLNEFEERLPEKPGW